MLQLNWRKTEVRKGGWGDVQGATPRDKSCMVLSAHLGSQSHPPCRCEGELRSPSACPEHWDWALTSSDFLARPNRKTFSSFLRIVFVHPPTQLWTALWCWWFPPSPEPWTGPASAWLNYSSIPPVLLLYFCRLSLLIAFVIELIFKYLMALSIVKICMKMISLFQYDLVQNN